MTRNRNRSAISAELSDMSSFELAMRNNSAYHPDVGAPPCTVTTIFRLDQVTTAESIKEDMIKGISKYARWGSVSDSQGKWSYLGANNMDWRYHISATPDFKDEKDENDFLQKVCKEELDMKHPLWRVYFGRLANGKGLAIVCMNHCIGDGLAMDSWHRTVCKSTDGADSSIMNPVFDSSSQHQQISWFSKFCGGVWFCLMWIFVLCKTLAKTTPFFNYETDCAWTNPRRKNKWKGSGSTSVKCITLPTIDLDVVKTVKNSLNSSPDDTRKYTVNNVLYGLYAGMAKRYCVKKDPCVAEPVLRSLITVGLPRGMEGVDNFRNHFVMCPIDMPMKSTTALERVKESNEIFGELAKTPLVSVMKFIMNVITNLPQCISNMVAADLYMKHSSVFSSIAHPDSQISFFGCNVESIHGAYGNFVHQVILLSYNHQIFGTICVDPTIVRDEDTLKQCFLEEYEELKNVCIGHQ